MKIFEKMLLIISLLLFFTGSVFAGEETKGFVEKSSVMDELDCVVPEADALTEVWDLIDRFYIIKVKLYLIKGHLYDEELAWFEGVNYASENSIKYALESLLEDNDGSNKNDILRSVESIRYITEEQELIIDIITKDLFI